MRRKEQTTDGLSLLPFLTEFSMNNDRFKDLYTMLDTAVQTLEKNGYIKTEKGIRYGKYTVKNVQILKGAPKKNDFRRLAQEMNELFPKGKRPDMSYQWRLSIPETVNRLQKLCEKLQCGFTDEEALRATKAYVASFSEDRIKYMKLLKYFIFKEVPGEGTESTLLTWIENTRGMSDEELLMQQEPRELTNADLI